MTDHPLAKKYFLNCSNTFGFDHLKSAFDDKIIKSDQSFANLLSRSRSPFSNKFFLAFSLIPLLLSGPTDCALQIISSLSNPFFTMCNAHMIMNQRKRRKERKKEILHCVCNFILPFQFKIWKVDLFKWNFFFEAVIEKLNVISKDWLIAHSLSQKRRLHFQNLKLK